MWENLIPAIFGLVGTIVGGLAAILGGIVTKYFDYTREQGRIDLEQKEKLLDVAEIRANELSNYFLFEQKPVARILAEKYTALVAEITKLPLYCDEDGELNSLVSKLPEYKILFESAMDRTVALSPKEGLIDPQSHMQFFEMIVSITSEIRSIRHNVLKNQIEKNRSRLTLKSMREELWRDM